MAFVLLHAITKQVAAIYSTDQHFCIIKTNYKVFNLYIFVFIFSSLDFNVNYINYNSVFLELLFVESVF